MERYADAVRSLDRVVTAHPEYWAARQQRWIAMLARDAFASPTKAQIAEEIRALPAHAGNNPEALYTAYRGHYYLNERPQRTALLEGAAPLAKAPTLRQQIAASLLEEIMTIRDNASQTRLSELYLQTFHDQRDIALASRILVSAVTQGPKSSTRKSISRQQPKVFLPWQTRTTPYFSPQRFCGGGSDTLNERHGLT